MSAEARIESLRRAASRRRAGIAMAVAALPALALLGLLARHAGAAAALAAAVVIAVALAGFMRRAVRVDDRWLARRLDAALPAMDDSAALLFAPADDLSAMQRLQRTRLQARLADADVDLRPQWPQRMLAASGLLALLLVVVTLAWPGARSENVATDAGERAAVPAAATAVAQIELAIEAPAYTHIAPRREAALDVKAPEGSRLKWRLRFDPQPKAAALAFHDGSRVELVRNGADWRGERELKASSLYRIVLDGAPPPADGRLHRLDAIADRAPEVRAIRPDRSLTLLDAQQTSWDLAFEAEDDYGLAKAELQVTLAQGSGENVTFKEQTIPLTGEAPAGASAEAGAARQLRYRHALDLTALGLSEGDDVVVRVVVDDNREPSPNVTRSASFILRRPAPASSESAGLEGIAQKTMPAYFRSQRQIIIDTEALLAEQPRPDDAHFLARSDAIGVDQKILRLRYGQFLGEEAETRAQREPEGHDDHDHDGDKASQDKPPTQADALQAAHEAHEGGAHGAAPTKFGDAGDVVAEYGHVHDIAEAATLLDPDTKATLKSALGEMWQAELHLRQGKPEDALPYERRALVFIKQVQQATRIYLARVGLELPAPDEARRLSGDRKGLADRSGSLSAAAADAPLAKLWQALAEDAAPDWSTTETWVHARESSLPDALGVLAAIDAARRDPACADCRARLRDLLWPLLPVPAAEVARRAEPDAGGRAYLDALHGAASKERAQ
jgi:hypothetical protein